MVTGFTRADVDVRVDLVIDRLRRFLYIARSCDVVERKKWFNKSIPEAFS